MILLTRHSHAATRLVHRYPDIVDERRASDLADLWTVDATLALPDGQEFFGREMIVAYYRLLWGALVDRPPTLEHPGLRHHVSNLRLARAGREIRATSSFVAFSRHGADHWGVYRDRIATARGGASAASSCQAGRQSRSWTVRRRPRRQPGLRPRIPG